ncbi:PIG-L deacetylase family protein [Curtobacterium sp. MCBD17_032]|uniref:PIG-L deacetylase family protein n=1 Tax=Curtobacterium sp. MCBD17_032 TaxID=2175659 RepID=UPI0021ABDA9F|nr:PIG-L family deacetylase [Curtobacterium sp. MCBD17_032]
MVAPHPDDETLGAGGLIAIAADRGLPVHVVLVSRGEGSHPESPTTRPSSTTGTPGTTSAPRSGSSRTRSGAPRLAPGPRSTRTTTGSPRGGTSRAPGTNSASAP